MRDKNVRGKKVPDKKCEIKMGDKKWDMKPEN